MVAMVAFLCTVKNSSHLVDLTVLTVAKAAASR
jgi:hypothetical protein